LSIQPNGEAKNERDAESHGACVSHNLTPRGMRMLIDGKSSVLFLVIIVALVDIN